MLENKRRAIASFVRRAGRMTERQKNALNNNWSCYGLDVLSEGVYDFKAIFGRVAPLYLEIGFGMGASLITMAEANPDIDFLGIEVHQPGVGALLAELSEQNLHNVRMISEDAVEILRKSIAENCFDRVLIYFPDPWPKLRHHKRRLIQGPFIELLVTRIKVGGHLHLATDWQHYAEQMLSVLSANLSLRNLSPTQTFIDNDGLRPNTKFEKRGLRFGHGIWDLLFEKIR